MGMGYIWTERVAWLPFDKNISTRREAPQFGQHVEVYKYA